MSNVSAIILCAAALAAVSVTATAATAATVSTDKRFVLHRPGKANFVPSFFHPGTKTTFFSNLGTKYPNGVYYPFYGYTISATNSALNFLVYPAVAFTPATSGTVTEVAAGLGYEDGTNSIALVVYADNGGVPGTVLKTFKLSNIIQAPGCCALAVAKDPAGIAVTAGTQYWVSAGPVKANGTTFAVWNTNTTDEVNSVTVAEYETSGWSAFATNFVPAIGVFGD